jgi:hypothetical protein
MKYMANIFTVDNKPLATSDLYTKYTFQLYVYGYDEDTNQIDFDVQVGRPEDEDITDRYTQPYDPNDWSQKSPDEYIKQPRNYELFSRQTIHYETASETTMMQLDEAMQKSVSLQKVYSEQNVSDLSTALNATIAMATEQYAAGVAYGVIAGVYYAASVGTFGATIASGIAATVGAAACFAGAAMATVSAGSISTHVHAIKHVLTNSMYSQWTDSVQELQVFLKKLPPQFSEVSAPDFRKAATL